MDDELNFPRLAQTARQKIDVLALCTVTTGYNSPEWLKTNKHFFNQRLRILMHNRRMVINNLKNESFFSKSLFIKVINTIPGGEVTVAPQYYCDQERIKYFKHGGKNLVHLKASRVTKIFVEQINKLKIMQRRAQICYSLKSNPISR